ncbi:MAG: cysteine rich repeat-containing protein [Rhodomicrobiaceae bacterium]
MPASVKTLILAFGLLSSGVLAASAQEPGPLVHLINQCRGDAANLCADVVPGWGRIAACLYAHIDKLRPGCRDAVEAGLAIRACIGDARQFCRGVVPGEGRIADCLSEFRGDLSPACRAVLAFGTEVHRRRDNHDEPDLLK